RQTADHERVPAAGDRTRDPGTGPGANYQRCRRSSLRVRAQRLSRRHLPHGARPSSPLDLMADEHHDPLPASFRVLGRHEAAAVPELWNSAWLSVTQGHNPYPLSAALWRERLESRHHDPELLWGGFVADELVAVAYGKLPKSDWQTPGVGWLALLAVEPGVQGRRLGTRLAAHLLRALAERGATVVKFGGEADHLLPGPPQESAPAVWRLLRRFGAKFGPAEHDLHLDLRPELPPAPLPAGWRLRTDDPAGAV